MLPPFAWRPLTLVCVAVAAVLTGCSPRYGFHRDELYFVVAGQHPALGHVDQPPLTPLVARLASVLLGDTPVALRVPATLATVATVVVVALIARELGGHAAAQLVAAGCAAVSSYLVVVGHMLSTATFDLLCWLLACWLLLRVLRTGDGRWWVAAGAVVGVAFLNKYLIVLLVGSVAVALLTLGPRDVLRTWWLPVGIVVALGIAAPNLWWQAANGWPQLTVAGGISADDGAENRIGFVPEQLLYLSPGFVPVWLAGLVRFFREGALRRLRAVAAAYPVACAVALVAGGKSYYVLPLLVVLLAAGVEPTLAWLRRGRVALRRMLAGFVVGTTVVATAVIGLPVLPPAALDDAGVLAVNKETGEQYGWPGLVATVAAGWRQVPGGRRDGAVILTDNYGQAGAIWVYGPRHGLPRPYSGHMSFADWRRPPDAASGPVLLVHQRDDRGLRRWFTGCRQLATHHNAAGLANEEHGAAGRALCRCARTVVRALAAAAALLLRCGHVAGLVGDGPVTDLPVARVVHDRTVPGRQGEVAYVARPVPQNAAELALGLPVEPVHVDLEHELHRALLPRLPRLQFSH